jgi:uncharacterized protein (TIGR02596 family)
MKTDKEAPTKRRRDTLEFRLAAALPARPYYSNRGFSLVEILFVISIIGILFAVASTGAKKSWQNQEIKASAMRLAHDITLASQSATKLNTIVQLRFYKYHDEAIVADDSQFHAYQIVTTDINSNASPLFEIQRLEGTTLISSSKRFSSVLGVTTPFNSGRDPDVNIGNYDYTSIEFHPDGSTNLDPDEPQPWTITLIPVRYAERLGELPKEFQTLAISPQTGSVRIY